MADENCSVWGFVDFGQGPVEIRCTQTGEHENHKCEIEMRLDPAKD